MKALILELHRIGAIKFGRFEIKRDFISPFQLDFSGVLGHPSIAKMLSQAIWEKASRLSFDLLCGGGILGGCLATYLAWENELPMVVRRVDVKENALKIIGGFKAEQECLLLEDFFLSGAQSLDAIDDLEAEGLKVRDVLAYIDLGLGAKKKFKTRGYVPHFVFTMNDVLNILNEANKVPGDAFKLSTDFLETQGE